MSVVSAFHPPSLNLKCLLQVSEKRCKQKYHSGAFEMLVFRYFSLHFCVSSWNFFFLHLTRIFFPAGCLGGTPSEGRKSQTRLMLFPHPLHTPDSTNKVSDVLKLFEDGDMAEYLQGDVSGNWEILSLPSSSHL